MQIMQQLGQAVVQARAFKEAARHVCQILRRELPHYNWVGVYMLRKRGSSNKSASENGADGEGDQLVLEAWDGSQPTQHVQIPIGEGICGLAAREARTVIVDDVNKDPRYLQCFLHTRSEIVVPIFKGKKVVGEIDIDSDKPAAFHTLDRLFLEWVADLLSQKA